MGFPGGASGKEPACQCRRCKRHGFNPWVGKIPYRRAWQPISVFLPGESHTIEDPAGLQSIGSQRVGHKWSDLACLHREGNGTPLQHSCLENPMDGGAWWAAVHGVTQSRTRLKWLRSSSMLTNYFCPTISFIRFYKLSRDIYIQSFQGILYSDPISWK